MNAVVQIVLRAATRFFAPLIVLLALSQLATRPAGSGVGFVAGVACAIGLTFYLMTFGAAALRAAFPPAIARFLLAFGAIMSSAAAGLPDLPYADRLMEAGLLFVTMSGAALVLLVVAGRAPTLHDEDWQ